MIMLFTVKDVVLELKPLFSKKKLLVSVAAGVKLKDLQVFVKHLTCSCIDFGPR